MWVIHHFNPCGLNSHCIIREPFLVKSRDCVAVAMSALVFEEIDYTSASSNGSRKRKNGAETKAEEGRYEKNVPNHFECDRCKSARTGSGLSKCKMYVNYEHEFTAWWCQQCYDAFKLFANRYDR